MGEHHCIFVEVASSLLFYLLMVHCVAVLLIESTDKDTIELLLRPNFLFDFIGDFLHKLAQSFDLLIPKGFSYVLLKLFVLGTVVAIFSLFDLSSHINLYW